MAFTRIQNRRGTAAEWTAANPTLARGEFGIEYDTGKFKLGTGTATWTSLPYFQDANGIIATIVDGAPSTLNTLNEIAEALNDNPDIIDTLATKNNPTFTGTADFTGATVLGIDALPSQSGQTGKYLTTDGVDASWGTVDLSSKQDVVSGVSSTEIGYLDGVTSAIQTQLNGKAAASHTHVTANISDLGTGVATFLTTPSSANLASAVTGETGSGGLVFSNSPSLDRATLSAPRFTVATTATAGGSTSLNGANAYYQVFTGTLNQTISLTNSADTVVGTQWLIVNNSTGVLTIQTSTAAVVTTVNPATAVLLTCIATPITTAANYNTEIMYRTERVSQTNGVVTTAAVGSSVVRNITLSTTAPTLGVGMDGDVWLVYTA